MSKATKEDLLIQLNKYKTQLETVENFLEDDSENVQFLKIKQDLLQVIQLTSEVYKSLDNNNSNNNIETNSNETNHINNKNVSDNDNEDEDEDDENNYNSVENSLAPPPPPPVVVVPQRTGPLQIGDIIEAIGGDRPYAGIIKEIDLAQGSCKIKYFEFETEVTLSLVSVHRIIEKVSRSDVSVGYKSQCKYSQDQRWYDCVVTSHTEHGVIVKYTQYGNEEEVPLAYLRPLAMKKVIVQSDELKEIKIPEKLKILATDTEEEKLRKKKKIKVIKSKNKIVQKDTELTQSKASWQKFQTKGSKKNLTGIIKQSMFQSSDSGKIGVINSGKGLTEFDQRKKNSFQKINN